MRTSSLLSIGLPTISQIRFKAVMQLEKGLALYIFLLTWDVTFSQICPQKFCTCKHEQANCSDQGTNLTYFPTLPKEIRVLTFSRNKIQNVTKETFEPITDLILKGIYLAYDEISYISKDAFEALPFLTTLYLRGNNISVDNLKESFYGLRGNELNNLYLQNMSLPDFPSDMFFHLRNCPIRHMQMKFNFFKILNGTVFQNLSKLERLDIGGNQISTIHLQGMHELRRLWLRWNKIAIFPNFCKSEKTSFLPKLEILDIGENSISFLPRKLFSRYCFPKLRNLTLDSNLILAIGDNVFSDLPHLSRLSLTWMKTEDLKFSPLAFNSTSLTFLYLANHLIFYNTDPDTNNIFKHCPNLETLDMRRIRLDNLSSESVRRMIIPLKRLKKLILQAANLYNIPDDLFAEMPLLNHLNLKNNYIKDILPNTFKNASSMDILYLDQNKLTTVKESNFPPDFLKRLKKLSLGINPFLCTCDLLWFRRWIDENKKKLLYFPEDYVCAAPTSMVGKSLNDFNPTDQECHPISPYVILAIVLSIVLAIIIITGTTLYKYRWHIKHYMYLLRSRRREYEPIPGEDYIYDAFVAYHSEDRVWIISELIPHLEKQENIKLCLHDRDFDVGHLIVDNIIDKINKSRKIMLILSNNFAKSRWCQFETMMAQNRQIQEGGAVLVLVMLENIDAKYMTDSLSVLLMSTTFIEWTELNPGNQLFWRRLVDCIKGE